MKKLIVYSILSLILINETLSQSRVSGYVYDQINNNPFENVAIFDSYSDKIFYSNEKGYFDFIADKNTVEIIFYSEGYTVLSKLLETKASIIK